MDTNTAPQLAAVYAEAAIAWLETSVPQAVLWLDDEERWDFTAADEELPGSDVVFLLQKGWDGQLSLDNPTDVDDEDYDSVALRDEVELQMNEEGIARAFIENLMEHRERSADADEDDKDHDDADEARDDEGDY